MHPQKTNNEIANLLKSYGETAHFANFMKISLAELYDLLSSKSTPLYEQYRKYCASKMSKRKK